ncbi:hypothetical protein ACI2LJ_30815 [Streptomyces sp. NPDC088090]|uniref:hypothetical protein n=1 Tax=Streptomyces sp. NPDC088090 TaxID=3365822 RepID=UPI00384FD96C
MALPVLGRVGAGLGPHRGRPDKRSGRRGARRRPAVGSWAEEITLCPAWNRITRRARQLLKPGAAVVVDIETTDL